MTYWGIAEPPTFTAHPIRAFCLVAHDVFPRPITSATNGNLYKPFSRSSSPSCAASRESTTIGL